MAERYGSISPKYFAGSALGLPARLIAAGALATLLSACNAPTAPGQSSAPRDPVAIAGEEAAAPPQDAACDAEAAAAFIGQPATPDVVEAARQAALAAEVRVIPKDGGATRDFRPGRLNLMLDADGLIEEVRCG